VGRPLSLPLQRGSICIKESKEVDAAGKARITLNEATAYYTALFKQLDKDGDRLLDALEALVPVMNTQSGKELLLKLDRNTDERSVSGHRKLAVPASQK
jgi:hypothetical protein